MGALLSLPLSTVIAIPLLSSYTTSFNLLFFTLNWYILLLSHPPTSVELYGILATRLLFFLLPALALLAFDAGVPSLAVQIKAQGWRAMPLVGGGAQRRRGAAAAGGQRKRLLKVVAVAVGNTVGGVGLLVGLEVLATRVLGLRSLLSLSKQLPMPWTAVKSVVYGVGIRGSLQYAIHRFALHESNTPFAKLHNQWQHSVAAPYALVAAYDHPLPYLLHHWIPLYLPAILFRTHLLVFLAITAIVSLEELMTYSGYSILPSAILVKGMARRIDTHFMTQGDGNYAAFGLLDWSCGTGIGSDVIDDLKAEWRQHDMDEKVQRGATAGGNLIEDVGNRIKNATNGRSSRQRIAS